MTKSPKLRSFHVPHERVQIDCSGDSRTKQSFKDECDINRILASYSKTGVLEHMNKATGMYGELPTDIDYQSNMNAVIAAQEAFSGLPSEIRNRFENDPAQFLAFIHEPSNHDEMVELGLVAAPATDDPSFDEKPVKENSPPSSADDSPSGETGV